ncbi:MAG: FtsH protease activity modulator HflK, partial [Pseudomonadota bacterium]
MPWNNNSGNGGPWGGGSGGSGGGPGGGSGGPWGSGPRGPTGGGSQPDLEELLKKSQDRLKSVIPSGGRGNVAILVVIAIALIAIWLANSIYTVQPDELGQELVFGKPKDTVAAPGLHFHFWPIETVEKVSTAQRTELIGESEARRTTGDSLMLSGDQNIVDIVFTVIWRVSDPKQFLFNVSDPQAFVRRVAESAMRETVGRSRADQVRTDRRAEVEDEVRELVQVTLDEYGAGITVISVQLEKADPPAEVADAFEEVQRAQQDQERFQREAEQYANRRLGEARGEAAQIRAQGAAYRDQVVTEAEGEANRFVSVFEEYSKAPD